MKKRKDGRWQKKIIINGKQIFLYSSAETERKAKKDFQNQLIEFNKKEKLNTELISELAKQVLNDKKNKSFNTFECYKNAYNKIASFKNKNIGDIVPSEWQNLINELSAQKYSSSSISKVKTFIGLIYNKAIMNGLPVSNPCRALRIESRAKNTVCPPTKEEVNIIRQSTTDFSLWAKFLMYTGLRPQELNALQFKDIKNGKIKIYKACEYPNNQAVIKTTKTESGIREIPIPDILKSELTKGTPNNYIFGSKYPFSKSQINKKWNKFKKENNINCTQYQLRHQYALFLYRANIPVKTAQYLLGHSDFSTTMNIYTQFDEEMNNSAEVKINEYFNNF